MIEVRDFKQSVNLFVYVPICMASTNWIWYISKDIGKNADMDIYEYLCLP